MKSRFCTYRSVLLSCVTVSLFTACHRAPSAFFQPTPRVSYKQVPAAPAPAVTASLTQEPPTATSNWQTERAADAPAPTEVFTTEVALRAERSVETRVVPQRIGSGKWRRATARQAPCDQIVLRNGDVIEAKVKEVGVSEVKYKKCDRPDGPDYTINKRDILSIKYSNGEVERFSATASPSSAPSSSNSRTTYNPGADGPRTDPFAIVSLATGGAAFLLGGFGLLLVASAIVFGAISLTRIKRQPERFKGRGLALAGMIVGVVMGGLIILALAAYY